MLFAVLVVVMVVGEVALYTDPYSFSSDVDSDGPTYRVEASGAAQFDIVQMDSGFSPPTEIYIYYDGSYGSFGPGLPSVEDLVRELNIRGMESTIVDADGLRDLMSKDPVGKAVVFISGAMPSTVYSGSAEDLAVSWMSSGGSVYWIGQTIGMYVSLPGGETSRVDGWESLFFGGRINDSKSLEIGDRRVSDIGDMICLRSSNAQYGMSVDVPDSLSLGYVTNDGYTSIGIAKYGEGMICIVGGFYSDTERTDLAQIVASGVTYDSEVVLHESVSVKGGENTGDLAPLDGSVVYIFAGGDYTSYGQRHRL